ncbi:integral peroxisomal membrane peroxin-domain-containing protein [Scheffersomyces amazonensis]|uniref:integral peroxisomal membrane peroxin-domain-containing protein n=1 Tax=Scheffersomyces amazonensis TaxID=1078765 RepID=UPI00315C7C39
MSHHRSGSLYEEASAKLSSHIHLSETFNSHSNANANANGNTNSISNGSSIGTDIDFTDEQLWEVESMPASAEESTKAKVHKSHHFVDRIMQKMLKYAIPDNAPEKVLFEQRLSDPEYSSRPGLSIRILLSNFKKLSSRMGGIFALQYGLIHIITWKKPTKTLTFLVGYTAICLWPHIVVAFPAIFLLFGIILPGYLYRHPKPIPDFIKVKKRGQSLLKFLDDSEDVSIIDDLISDEFMHDHDPNALKPLLSRSGDDSSETASTIDTSSIIDESEKKDKSYISSQVALIINMRDLQNLTTDLLLAFDAAEEFWFKTAGFANERLSTFMFYGAIAATWIILFLGQFIPWRFIFIQTGWAGLILCHPKSKKFIVELNKVQKQRALLKPKSPPKEVGEPQEFDRKDIIIDEAPEKKTIEVYELQAKSILHNKWSFYRYSNNIFDLKSKTRVAGKRPSGVDHLAKVLPPKDWKLDLAFANKWQTDTDPKGFLHRRGLESRLLEVRDDAEEGWIYDKKHEEIEISYEFRRRRLFRECYRYAREPKQPTKYL